MAESRTHQGNVFGGKSPIKNTIEILLALHTKTMKMLGFGTVFRIRSLSHRHLQRIYEIRWLILHITHHFSWLHTTTHYCNSTNIHLRPWHTIVIRHLAGELNAFCASEVKLKRNLRLHVRARRTRGQSNRPRSLSSGYLFISHPVTFRAVTASTSCNCTCRCLRSHRFYHDAKHKRNDGDRLVSHTNDCKLTECWSLRTNNFSPSLFVYNFVCNKMANNFFFLYKGKKVKTLLCLIIQNDQVKNGTGATHWMSSNRYQFY